MTASGVRSSWAASIVGDLPPPRSSTTTQQPPREVHTHTNAADHDIISMPPFAGRYNPDIYIEWEFEINAMFVSHDFSEGKKVKDATSTFIGFASIWWNEYCRTYPDCIPTTWHDLKLAMRYRFVPSYYTRDMVKKLKNLKQGNNGVKEYYDTLQTTLLRSFVEESEEDVVDRFWRGLNHDIQDMVMHVDELYFIDHLFHLAYKAD